MVVLQWAGGAYTSEFGAHADEAAHYVTGLMMRDYIAAGLPGAPLAFAQNYYDHYPKVALGNWPPAFYMIQSAWTLLFTPSRTSVMFLMAVLTSILAVLVLFTLMEDFGTARAILGGVLFISFPLVQQHAGMVMTEIPVALFSFLAVLCFGRYLDRPGAFSSVLFGVFASAAIMTKGSGLVLALVPPLALLFSRRFELTRRLDFWYPVPMVTILCGPWTWAFHEVARAGWMEDSFSLHYTLLAVRQFPRELILTVNVLVGGLGLVGLVVMLVAATRRTIRPLWAAAAALVCGVLIFHAIVPASLDARHLVQALPAWSMFVVAGVAHLQQRWFTSLAGLRWLPYGVAAAGAIQVMWAPPEKRYEGFGAVVAEIIGQPANSEAVVLISSDASGEGMFIAETAMRDRRPGHIIRRSSKALASQTWSGGDYRMTVDTEPAVHRLLEKERIRFVVVDDSIPDYLLKPHHKLLRAAVTNGAPKCEFRGTYPVRRADVHLPHGLSVYEIRSEAVAPSRPADVLSRETGGAGY